jgi:transposase InsO family protein
MRYSQAEKMEIIRIVEDSELSVRQTLKELDINRSTFYAWYRRYEQEGYDGLANKKPNPGRFWNKIPQSVREQIVAIALEHPEKSPRQLAWYITDNEGYYISESSVYRILKAYDLISSPAFIVLSARDKFQQPTRGIHELWQTDFTYFKVSGWGWYYLSTVIDDYSRYVICWKLFTRMSAGDVKQILDMALQKSRIDRMKVRYTPRLLSDNGPCYLAGELREYLQSKGIKHIRGAPYHPMTQGKIERYHRTMKNMINLQNYYMPWELESEISGFVDYYNNYRYHESLDNLTPADVYFGRDKEILNQREQIKKKTLRMRRMYNLRLNKQNKMQI